MDEEIFIDIKGYEGLYRISNKGRLKSVRRNKIMSPGDHVKGYKIACLRKHKKSKGVLIHRLVASHFINNPENKPQVNHINGIKNDNRVENLEWVTCSENHYHAYKNGLMNGPRGEESPSAILTNKNALEIRLLYKDEVLTKRELSKKYGVSEATIYDVVKRRTFKHI